MTSAHALTGLVAVARAALAADEARMTALRRDEHDLRMRLAELDAARRTRDADATVEDAALRAGADLRWHLWIEQRRAALNRELAIVLVRIDRARTEMTRSFGRKTAIDALRDEVTAAERKLWNQRQDRAL